MECENPAFWYVHFDHVIYIQLSDWLRVILTPITTNNYDSPALQLASFLSTRGHSANFITLYPELNSLLNCMCLLTICSSNRKVYLSSNSHFTFQHVIRFSKSSLQVSPLPAHWSHLVVRFRRYGFLDDNEGVSNI